MEDEAIETHCFQPSSGVPNHPEWPLLLYREAFNRPDLSPGVVEDRFRGHHWAGTWRNGVYGFHHYHSTAHEVLGVARGSARVTFGGEGGVTVDLSSGDVAVLPAGTGHRKESAEAGFLVVGGYPRGQTDWDLRRAGEMTVEEAHERILRVGHPDTDPVHGKNGPLVERWT